MSEIGGHSWHIWEETGQEDIFQVNVKYLKRIFKFCPIQNEDKWKVIIIQELTDVKQGAAQLNYEGNENYLSTQEIEEIIKYVSSCWIQLLFSTVYVSLTLYVKKTIFDLQINK